MNADWSIISNKEVFTVSTQYIELLMKSFNPLFFCDNKHGEENLHGNQGPTDEDKELTNVLKPSLLRLFNKTR